MQSLKITLIAGFAMFSMFFGSGNLVFPLAAGFKTQGSFTYALYGWITTAVIVPFIGVLGFVRAEGNRDRYYSALGKSGAFAINFLIFMLVGPFGVIPRCILVSYGGFKLMYPSLPLWIFSAIFVSGLLMLCWERNKLVEIIGIFLTPLKLGGIAFLIAVGIYFAPSIQPIALSSKECIGYGLEIGYQTMDLLAAPLIAGSIYEYLLKKSPNNASKAYVFKLGVYASILGGAILCMVYYGFMSLGAHYSQYLVGLEPEQYLAAISQKALGNYALPIVSLTLAVSCMATATLLTTMWTDFLQKDIMRRTEKRKMYLVISLVIAFAMSLLGFKKIMIFLGSILEWLYPLMIIYAVYKLVDKKQNKPIYA
jgi:LIVCS family branched-chain amino acid:cation transporter